MASGKVKWFNNTKGFGFISQSDGSEVFVHFTSIGTKGFRTLVEGEEVSFDIVRGDRGLKAENVQRLNPPPPPPPYRPFRRRTPPPDMGLQI